MKCIVTGFEAFEGVDRNPTEEIVRELPPSMNGVELLPVILPVEYGVVERMVTAELYSAADAVFMLGAAGEAEFGRLEVQAFNWCQSEVADNCGLVESGRLINPLVAAGSPRLSPVAVDKLLDGISDSPMPWRRSEDPGRFVCNDSYYRMLERSEKREGRCPTLFVHIPVPGRTDSIWELKTISESVSLLLAQFLDSISH